MPSLRELQQAFGAGLGQTDVAVARWLRGDGLAPERRLQVYRNNHFLGLSAALTASFPVVRRLVGENFFDHVAQGYIHAHALRQGNLQAYGEGFAAYLAGHPGCGGLPYLAPVAELEWARQEAYRAADSDPLDGAALAAVDPDRLEALHLRPHPSLRLIGSDYPVQAIWEANQEDADGYADLDSGGQRVAVRRIAGGLLQHILLDAGSFAFLYACFLGQPLLAAAEQALAADPAWNFQAVLSELVADGLISGFDFNQRREA